MGVLLMLMTIGGIFVAGVLLVVSLVLGKAWLAKFTVGGVAVWFVFYVLMLFGFSFASSEQTLAMNEPKAFCGFYLDCHMHAQVTKVETGDRIFRRKAEGQFYVVTVEVFSDARNPNIWFRLVKPKAEMVDSLGRTYERNEDAESDLSTGPRYLGADVKGEETFKKELVFDIPKSATGLRLLITDGYRIDRLIESVLIGDEDSVMHKHTYFAIDDAHPGTAPSFGAPVERIPISQVRRRTPATVSDRKGEHNASINM